MANIRNQDSWIHYKDSEAATAKAKDLVRMAVAKAARLKTLKEKIVQINKQALIIGGGVAGMNAALNLGNQGFDVVLVEKDVQLGGFSRKLHHTIEGKDIQQYLKDLIAEVTAHEKIKVLTEARIIGFEGFKGNFETTVEVGPEKEKQIIKHGVIIVATGGKEYTPKEFLYEETDKVVTQVELSDILEEKGAADLNNIVMIQCVGSRNEDNVECSRICCQSAIKNALHIKELNPDAQVYVLYRDIRT
jgi:heterodisulfide reductase subunit A-like polyferredoxin